MGRDLCLGIWTRFPELNFSTFAKCKVMWTDIWFLTRYWLKLGNAPMHVTVDVKCFTHIERKITVELYQKQRSKLKR